jgi:hypothetical protein
VEPIAICIPQKTFRLIITMLHSHCCYELFIDRIDIIDVIFLYAEGFCFDLVGWENFETSLQKRLQQMTEFDIANVCLFNNTSC